MSAPAGRLLATLLIGWSALLASCSSDGPEPRRNSVLLITLDTLRADHLGAYGNERARTPHLDALAQQGIRYERAYSPAPITLVAHASLMTGLYPFEHGVRANGNFHLSDGARTLAEVLGEHGYATGAVVGAFVLDRRFGLAQGFDFYDDAISRGASAGAFGFAERSATAVTDAALAWLSGVPKKPFFLWVHYFDPHAAYEPHSDDREFAGLLPYDAEISFMDREIGRLLAHIPSREDEDDPAIIVAADHGEGLWEHGEISHSYFVYDSTLRAALILKLPDGTHAGSKITTPVSLVDVFPTVLGFAGIPAADSFAVSLPTVEPEPAPGRSARTLYFENYAVAYSFGLSPLRGVVRGSDKWIDAPRPERYELDRDPHELKNRAGEDDPLSSELREAMQRLLEDRTRVVATDGEASPMLGPEVAARLAELGYLALPSSSPGPIPPDELPAGSDPKDAVGTMREILLAENWIGMGRSLRAAETLAAVLGGSDPVNPRAVMRLAGLATGVEGRETAIEALLPYLERDLDPALRFVVAAKLGIALGRSGRYAEAVQAYEIALQLEPNNAEVAMGLENARRFDQDVHP